MNARGIALTHRLTCRVTLQSASETADGQGGKILSWYDVASVPAEILSLPSSRDVQRERATVNARYRVTLRHREDVTSAMRIVYEGRVLVIERVTQDIPKQRFLILDVHEGDTV